MGLKPDLIEASQLGHTFTLLWFPTYATPASLCYIINMSLLSGKLSERLVETLDQGRHGDGNGLYLVVDPSGARRWIVRVVIKGQKNRNGGPLRTDLGLGGADVVSLQTAREKAREYRQIARQGRHPSHRDHSDIPTFEEFAEHVYSDRAPYGMNARHGRQCIKTLRSYAFPKIGHIPINKINQREVLACVSPLWEEKKDTAKRLMQHLRYVLDTARSKGYRVNENPVLAMQEAKVLPNTRSETLCDQSFSWREIPAIYEKLRDHASMSAQALRFICLTGTRPGEVLKLTWDELFLEDRVWVCPAERTRNGVEHHVPLTDEMLTILEPLREIQSQYVFKGQKRNQPLTRMAMQMLMRRMQLGGVSVSGFQAAFWDWASEVAGVSCQLAPIKRDDKAGSASKLSYPAPELLDHRRQVLEAWSAHVTGTPCGRAVPAAPELWEYNLSETRTLTV